jgi:putative ABC transport system substrate-binding protein
MHLKETGYIDGENVLVEYRWAASQLDRLPELADDLVRRQAVVTFASGCFRSRPRPRRDRSFSFWRMILFELGLSPTSPGLVAIRPPVLAMPLDGVRIDCAGDHHA